MVRELACDDLGARRAQVKSLGVDLLDLSFRGLDASESLSDGIDCAMTIGSTVFLAELGGDLVVLHASAAGRESYEGYPLPARLDFENVLRQIGMADWCARLGFPIRSSDGEPVGFGVGPLPDPAGWQSVFSKIEVRAPDLTPGQARRRLAGVLSRVLPPYRDALDRSSEPGRIHDARRLARLGAEAINIHRRVGLSLLADSAAGSISLLLLLAGGSLTLLASARNAGDRARLKILTEDDLARADADIGGIDAWIAAALP